MTQTVMRVDAHQHFWHYDPKEYLWINDQMPELKKNRLPKDIAPLLAQHDFHGCIAVQARQSNDETDFLIKLSKMHPCILGIVGWTDLLSNDLDETLAKAKEKPIIKGYRHLVQDEEHPSQFLLNHKFNRGVKELLNQGFIYEVLVHEKDLSAAIQFCQKHSHNILVLDHLGKPDIKEANPDEWKKKIKPFASLDHVYCKLSGMVTEAETSWMHDDIYPYIEVALEVFGPSRLLFGSDWPVCLLSANYASVYQLVELSISQLSTQEQEAIFGMNAKNIYRL